ncbi:hypothetical protein AB1Y20_020476 [Prymnesium parvum]|uniref:Uncharacterized protein n=1 Tax=Prymnesium parvum TaxID=97485 RepID=A0AB34JXG9_PRYPA
MCPLRHGRGVAWLLLYCARLGTRARVCHISEVDRRAPAWKLPRGCVALDLSFSAIGPEGAAQLSHLLARRPLQGLNLTWSAIGLDGIPSLVRGLERCQTLTTLDISGNWISDSGALFILTALRRFGTIRNLFLRWNGITSQGAAHIAEVLSELPKLDTLDLGGNWLLDQGVEHVMRGLSRHTGLRELHLDYTGVGPASMAQLESTLRNMSLECLDLSGNHLDNAGAAHLARALRMSNSSRLHTLRLRQNEYIGDDGVAALARLLTGVPTLMHLDLSGNRIGDAGAASLLNATRGSTISEIQLEDNSPRRSLGRALPPGISATLLQQLRQRQPQRDLVSTSVGIREDGVRAPRQASETQAYWAFVYPTHELRQAPVHVVNFLYATAPKALVGDGCEQHAWSQCRLDAYFEDGRTPPHIPQFSFFSPFRLPPGACMKSLFQWGAPNVSAWEASYVYSAGIPDQGWAEVVHTREQTGGAWLYLAPGSGIFWNCGRSLRARNKVAAAVQLLQERHKLTRSAALRLLAREIAQKSSNTCDEQHCTTFMNIFLSNRSDRNDNCYGRCHSSSPLHSWLERAAYGNGAQEWWYDHMSASSVFDRGLYKWAKQLKYQSVQLTMQPQVWCGLGWTTELLDLRVRPHRILDILPHLSTRIPHVSSLQPEPCIVRPDNASRKAFQICTYCEGTHMERNARCLADASRGRPKFTIYSHYSHHRFDACIRASE